MANTRNLVKPLQDTAMVAFYSGEADGGGDTDLPILGMGIQAFSRYWENRIINTIVLEGGIRVGLMIYGDCDTDTDSRHPVIGI